MRDLCSGPPAGSSEANASQWVLPLFAPKLSDSPKNCRRAFDVFRRGRRTYVESYERRWPWRICRGCHSNLSFANIVVVVLDAGRGHRNYRVTARRDDVIDLTILVELDKQ